MRESYSMVSTHVMGSTDGGMEMQGIYHTQSTVYVKGIDANGHYIDAMSCVIIINI